MQVRPIPEEVLVFRPEVPLRLKKSTFSQCLREAPSGSSPGPGGCSNEILRVCLDDSELLQLFMLATMTTLHKADGGVRGIATGTVFCRLAKCLSRQYVKEVEKVCAPYQFAMSTRARGPPDPCHH